MRSRFGSPALAGVAATLVVCICPFARGLAATPPVRDGSHDFDFLYGSWFMHNRRLKHILVGSHDWVKFDSTDEARPLPGALGNEDFDRSSYPGKGFVGMTLRLYDPATGVWRLYWIDNVNSHGDAGMPNVGKWHGNVGIFDERLMVHGKATIDRYRWTKFGSRSRITAHFEESMSQDGGKTWELIYVTDLIRTSHPLNPFATR